MKWSEVNASHHGKRAIVAPDPAWFKAHGREPTVYTGYIVCPEEDSVPTLAVNEHGRVGVRMFDNWVDLEIIND